ncbi:MAG: iron-containing redox enzyme family protein [Pseudomonadota bacterium]
MSAIPSPLPTRLSPARALRFDNAFIVGTGSFLPGPPINNDDIANYIAPMSTRSRRIMNRVLRDNGIQTRHYAIDEAGYTRYSSAKLAERAVRSCVDDSGVRPEDISLLCTGSSGGDIGMPGFANMVQGALGLPPMETSSHQGVCASGMSALKYAASAVELGAHQNALVATSELPSRLFKQSRFRPSGYDQDFDAQFLRWMLSDGAGACLVSRNPERLTSEGVTLKIDWIHHRSFSGDHPVCMQIGFADANEPRSYLDYPSLAEAERDGAFLLRQDIRLLPNLFELGIHEFTSLAHQGYFKGSEIDHFVCHYSSEKFSGLVDELMHDAGLGIPKEKWYSNLTWRGNTGAASIFIMLRDFLQERSPKPGERIMCFVPESGRFTISCMMLTVVDNEYQPPISTHAPPKANDDVPVPPPHNPSAAKTTEVGSLLQALAEVWHDYRSRVWRTDLVKRILDGAFRREDYLNWMACWIPQVREGSRWMRAGASKLAGPYVGLSPLIDQHADEEHLDYEILFDDYRKAGGTVSSIDELSRNPGGDALNSYMYARAREANPTGLLGGIYIIEGTGQRIIPRLMPHLRRCDGVPSNALRFLHYHGENDVEHLNRWLQAVHFVMNIEHTANKAKIINTARDTAELYLMQMRESV